MAQSSSNNSLNSRRTVSIQGHTPTDSNDTGALPYHWHDKQELMQRELEEARARATQMEKTMRWWSDCTANWREKWSKVRSERNKAREEVRLLRSRLEAFQRQINVLQRQKTDLETKDEQDVPQLMSCQEIELRAANKVYDNYSDSPERDNNIHPRLTNRTPSMLISSEKLDLLDNSDISNASLINEALLSCGIDRLRKGVENVSVYSHSAGDASKLSKKCRSFREKDSTSVHAAIGTKDSFAESTPESVDLQQHLLYRENGLDDKMLSRREDALIEALMDGGSGLSSNQQSPHRMSTVSDPLAEACHASPRISAISDPLSEVCGASECSETGYAESIRSSEGVIGKKWKSNDRAQSGVSSSILDDSGITPEQESLEQQVTMLKLRLEEASKTIQVERELADLRGELERLQEENAAEWGRRERLQSEKLNIERENKKLKSQITDLEDRLQKRNKMSSSASEADVSSLKEDISQKSKELAELKHAHTKLKKVLADKSTDLQHSNKRGDQYEGEVKRLRSRVDELKKELAAAEDEVDCASNNIRKLHRSNDELQETVENLQVQVEHLQSRLRSSQTTSIPTLSRMEDSDDEKLQY